MGDIMLCMKPTAIIVSLFLLVFATKEAEGSIRNYVNASATGDDSSVNVKINNSFGTTNSNTSNVQGESTTRVEINQEGTGTSSVNVNGKEYKVEGPGNLNVEEKTPTGNEESNTTTPSATVTKTEDLNLSAPDVTTENNNFLRMLFSQIRESLKNFLGNLF